MSDRETRLLRKLVRVGLADLPPVALTEQKRRGIDWSFFIASARRHRLSSLVYEAVRRGKLDADLPRSIWSALYSDYYTNLAMSLVLFDHLEALMDDARKRGIPILLLKGAAFAGWLYRNPALRPMSDLDVLVRRRDLDSLVRAAEKLGYERYAVSDHALSLRHPESGTYLELHTSLTSCPDYLGTDVESLIRRSIPSAAWPDQARTIAPEDHLLHLCLHGSFQHGLRQPAINACDTYLCTRLPDLDWEVFLKRVASPRLAPLAYAGLGLCHCVFPSPATEHALKTLAPHVLRRHRRWLEALDVSRLLSPEHESTWGSPWSRILWTTSLKDAYHLIGETLRPHGTEATPTPWSTLGRGIALVYRHAVVRWSRTLLQTSIGARTEP